MIKSETQIAEENIRLMKDITYHKDNCAVCQGVRDGLKEHKASCERFLEFLEVILEEKKIREGYMGKFINDRKITALHQK